MAPPFQEENKGKAAKPAPLRGCALSPSSVRPERLRRRQRSCFVQLVTQFSPLLPQTTPPPRQTPPLGGTRQYFLPCDTYWRSVYQSTASLSPAIYLPIYSLSPIHPSIHLCPTIYPPTFPPIYLSILYQSLCRCLPSTYSYYWGTA